MKNTITISREEFFNFIKGKKETSEHLTYDSLYYLRYFDKFMETGKKTSWSWPGFLFGSTWLLYRKIYAYLMCLIVFQILFGLLVGASFLIFSSMGEQLIDQYQVLIEVSFHLAFRVIIAIWGNYWYVRFASKNIKEGSTTRGTHRVISTIGLTFVLSGLIGGLGRSFEKMLDRISSDSTQIQVSHVPARHPLLGRESMRSKDIATQVKSIVAQHLGVPPERVVEDATFIEDLRADSLDVVELVMAFEEKFDIEIPDGDVAKIQTVQDAVDYIVSKKN